MKLFSSTSLKSLAKRASVVYRSEDGEFPGCSGINGRGRSAGWFMRRLREGEEKRGKFLVAGQSVQQKGGRGRSWAGCGKTLEMG